MKALIASLLIACTAPAMADTLTIATGKAGGGYAARAKGIAERLVQRGHSVTVTNLNGSDEISLALCGGRADIGLMQIDAIYARAQEGCSVKSVAVYGAEYAFILFPPKSKISKLEHLTAQDAVMVDTIGSGSDLFWRTITRIETGDEGDSDPWSSARVVNDPLELAQAAASMGDISAVVLVRKTDSADVRRLLELGWTLGELWDRDIDDLIFNGAPLYASEKKDLKLGDIKARGWVYEVRSFIAVTNAIAGGDRQTFAAITGAAQ